MNPKVDPLQTILWFTSAIVSQCSYLWLEPIWCNPLDIITQEFYWFCGRCCCMTFGMRIRFLVVLWIDGLGQRLYDSPHDYFHWCPAWFCVRPYKDWSTFSNSSYFSACLGILPTFSWNLILCKGKELVNYRTIECCPSHWGAIVNYCLSRSLYFRS